MNQIKEYFESIEKKIKESYNVAEEARKKKIDPSPEIEVPIAKSLAERTVGLLSLIYPQINDKKIIDRILELEKQHSQLDPAIALIMAEEIAKEKHCKFRSHKEAVEAGIRIALAYLTLGCLSSPIEGFIQLKIKKTRDGKDYFAPFYSGPIRSAGGTEAAFSLVVVDYLRNLFGYAKYDPTEEEVKRGIQECYEYHERITNLQYLPSEQEIDFLMRNLPIQLSGEPSEDKEVYNYKDLERVETNFIRNGFALVLGEGIAQKAPKILGRIKKLQQKGFKLDDWNWLEDFVKLQKKIKEGKEKTGSRVGATYIQDLVAGRPVFGHPGKSGAFRLRYGRARNTGYSALAVHPATMAITKGFIAIGTQLKVEKPTKGGTIAVCDSIDGPIVKLKNGSVKSVQKREEAEKIYKDVEEIIYLGDLLVPYGDFNNRNHNLEKAGYVEQFWLEELKRKGGESELFPSFFKAVELSQKYKIPLHPKFIFYWSQIDQEMFFSLLDWVSRGKIVNSKLVLPYASSERERFAKGKRALEIIGCEHDVAIENVIVSEQAKALLLNLGIQKEESLEEEFQKVISKSKKLIEEQKKILEVLTEISGFEIRDKAGTFIGARMGRPEKAKLRKMEGSPHVLFPVGEEGGRLRSFQAAVSFGKVKAEFPIFYCEKCKEETIYGKCEKCDSECIPMFYCSECEKIYPTKCEMHGKGENYREKEIEIEHFFDSARKKIGLNNGEVPILKGVRGTSNKEHYCENLAKGFLRAKHNLRVNKDGTIRYDMTEMPLTHFKPIEIGTSVEKLRELGYTHDINGEELKREEQLLELRPHDIVLPSCPNSLDEKADDVFFNVSKFVDEELEKLYGLKPYYNLKKKEDIVGHLFACIAPHICTAVVARVIGFSKTQVFLASPYMHAALRRDCDGDEAAVMLLMDLLLNFSRAYLPSHRGGTQDAPLVLNIRLKAGEVDDMVFDLDVSRNIPLELYEAAEIGKSPREITMEQVRQRLGTENEFENLWYSYETSDINAGQTCSVYKTLPTMDEKVAEMMDLCTKIRAVDTQDVSRLIIERHFIRDIRGNLRKFSQQAFRCVNCNAKYRRPPLVGKCTKCGGRLLFTISEGSILKYLQPALELARKYKVSPYLLENLELTERYIQSIFGKEAEKQETISKWF